MLNIEHEKIANSRKELIENKNKIIDEWLDSKEMKDFFILF
jgi:hypothetical protein